VPLAAEAAPAPGSSAMTGQSCLVSRLRHLCSRHLGTTRLQQPFTQSWSKTFCSIQASAPGMHWLMAQNETTRLRHRRWRRALDITLLRQCIPLHQVQQPYTHNADLTSLSVQASAPDVHWLMAQTNYAPVVGTAKVQGIGARLLGTMIHPSIPRALLRCASEWICSSWRRWVTRDEANSQASSLPNLLSSSSCCNMLTWTAVTML
jgi:hypothetical protein